MTTVDELSLDPEVAYHRVTLANGREVPGQNAQRYAAHLACTVDRLIRLAHAAAVVASASRPTVLQENGTAT